MGDPYPGKIKYFGGKPVQLTYEEIVASVAIGGWPEKLWDTAVAVAHYESVSGAHNVYNTYKEGHWGLFQVSKSAHREFFARPDAWLMPWENAREAYRIYQRQGWGAWEAYTNGRYAARLLQAKAAVAAVKAKRAKSSKKGLEFYKSLYRPQLLEGLLTMAAVGGGQEGLADSLAGAGEFAGETVVDSGAIAADAAADQAAGITGLVQMLIGAGKWIADPGSWLRVGQVVVGGGLLLAGIAIMAKPAATAVAPVTRALKSVGK